MAELKPTEKSSVSGICKNCNDHIREKLVELMGEHNSHYVVFCDDCFKDTPEEFNSRMYGLADHLLANGVTVQEWIPVTERLPQHGDIVLCNTRYHYEVLQWDDRANRWVNNFMNPKAAATAAERRVTYGRA